MGTKKRPCRICRKWFLPGKRGGHQQKTCGGPTCRSAWHKKKCREWHQKNRGCRIEDRFASLKDKRLSEPPTKLSTRAIPFEYPHRLAREVMGQEAAVFLEFMLKVVFNAARAIKHKEPPVNKGDP